MSARVVLHCDVDGFYVACELLRRPELRGLPLAVTQFNSGGFVAVSEEARQQGVGKGDGIGAGGQKALDYFKDRPDALMSAVRRRCPQLVVLPMDTLYYRRCSAELHQLISEAPCWRAPCPKPPVEKASIDDFYIDCTEEVRHRAAMVGADSSVHISDPDDQGDEEDHGRMARAEPDADNKRGDNAVGSSSVGVGVGGGGRRQRGLSDAGGLCPTYLDALSLYGSGAATTSESERQLCHPGGSCATPCTPSSTLRGPSAGAHALSAVRGCRCLPASCRMHSNGFGPVQGAKIHTPCHAMPSEIQNSKFTGAHCPRAACTRAALHRRADAILRHRPQQAAGTPGERSAAERLSKQVIGHSVSAHLLGR
jgi:hypothetical protein